MRIPPGLLIAMQLLTRIPLRQATPEDASPERRSSNPPSVDSTTSFHQAAACWFPLVGALLAMLSIVPMLIAERLFGPMLAAIACVAASMLLSGALHEDGLADSADALMGMADRDAALRIMKDSRIGSYGTLALVLCVLIRVALIAGALTLSVPAACALVVAMHAGARAMLSIPMCMLPHAADISAVRNSGFHAQLPSLLCRRTLATGFAVVLACACVACWAVANFGPTTAGTPMTNGAAALTVFARALLVVFVCSTASAMTVFAVDTFTLRRIGGRTGDTLGATEQCIEIVIGLCGLALLRCTI